MKPGPCSVCGKPSPDGRYCSVACALSRATNPKCGVCGGRSSSSWICKLCRKDAVNIDWQMRPRNEHGQTFSYLDSYSPDGHTPESARSSKLHPRGFKSVASRKPIKKPRHEVFDGAGTSYATPTCEKIMRLYVEGVPQRKIAALVDVNPSYVQRVIAVWNERQYNNPRDKAIQAKSAIRTTKNRLLVGRKLKERAQERQRLRYQKRLDKLLGPVDFGPPPLDDARTKIAAAMLRAGKSRDDVARILECDPDQVRSVQDILVEIDPEYFF